MNIKLFIINLNNKFYNKIWWILHLELISKINNLSIFVELFFQYL